MKHLLVLGLIFVLLWVAPVAGAATENEAPTEFPTTLCADTCNYETMEIRPEAELSSIFMDSQGAALVDPYEFIQGLYTLPARKLETSYTGAANWAGIFGIEGELERLAYFRFGVLNNHIPGPLYYFYGSELLYKPDGLFLYTDSIIVLFMQETSSGRVFAFPLPSAQMWSVNPDGSFYGQHTIYGAYEVDRQAVVQLFMGYLNAPTV